MSFVCFLVKDGDCQGPLLGRNSKPSANGRNVNNRRRRFRFGLMSDRDAESTGYTTDDPALENISVLNDAGLTDAEG